VSALWAELTGWPAQSDRSRAAARARLRAVPSATPRLARRPFAVVLIALFGVGMTGLLMLNTALQGQAFQSTSLNRQATELAHVQDDLEKQLEAAAAPQELARRATLLGMRANPRPAFLVVPSGKVIGKPLRVTGHELPDLIVKTPRQVAAADAAAQAKRDSEARAKAAARRAKALRAEWALIAAEQAKQEAARRPAGQPKPGVGPTPSDAGGTGQQTTGGH
jgi:hypothetical protein